MLELEFRIGDIAVFMVDEECLVCRTLAHARGSQLCFHLHANLKRILETRKLISA